MIRRQLKASSRVRREIIEFCTDRQSVRLFVRPAQFCIKFATAERAIVGSETPQPGCHSISKHRYALISYLLAPHHPRLRQRWYSAILAAPKRQPMNLFVEHEAKMRGFTQMRVSIIASLAILTLLAVVPAAHAQSTVGTITQVQGTANIQRNGANIAAVPNLPVMLHDQISTDTNGSLTISLVDNSSLQLGASSTITIDNSVLVNGVGAPSKVGLLNGDLHTVILGAMRGTSTTFEVNTPNAIGAVRGTEWSEHYDTEDHHGCRKTTKFNVEDGTVQVCNTENPPVCKDIHKGEHTEVRCGAFWEGGGLGGIGAGALGLGLAAGAGVGIAAGAGAFNGSGGGGGQPPPATKSK